MSSNVKVEASTLANPFLQMRNTIFAIRVLTHTLVIHLDHTSLIRYMALAQLNKCKEDPGLQPGTQIRVLGGANGRNLHSKLARLNVKVLY